MLKQISTFECFFCGRKLSQDGVVMIGCCPVCVKCYRYLMRCRR